MCIVSEEWKPFKALRAHLRLRKIGGFFFAAVGFPAIAAAQTVYIGTGEQGETSFSDEPPMIGHPVATVTLEPARPAAERPVADGSADRSDDRSAGASQIDQMLTVAAALETSRIQRESQRAEARRERERWVAGQGAPAPAPAAAGVNLPWWPLQGRRRSALGGFYQDGPVYHDPRLRPQAPFRSGFGDPRIADPRLADRDDGAAEGPRRPRRRDRGPIRSSPLPVD